MSLHKACDNEDKTHDPINRVTPPVTNKFLAGKQILIADTPLPATISHSVVQLCTRTLFTILFIDEPTMFDATKLIL